MTTRKPTTTGIQRRVRRDGTTAYRAEVFDNQTGRKIRKTFASHAEAVAWRQDSASALRKGTLRAPRRITVREAAEQFLRDCEAGLARTRGGKPFKPAAIRGMEQNLRLRVLPILGDKRFDELRRRDVQALVDKLDRAGTSAGTIQTSILPLQVMCRRALARDEISVNPTTGIEKPTVQSRRDRVVTVTEGDTLLAVLDRETRPVWQVAMYAGLRRGEIGALRCGDVNLADGLLTVRHGWDKMAGEITPKNGKERRVPIVPELHDVLADRLLLHRDRHGNVRSENRVFGPDAVDKAYTAARRTWEARGADAITLHDCRHVFATQMIFAGVNPKALSDFLGHASIQTTFNQYGHLLPGSEAEAAQLHADYLQRERTKARTQEDSDDAVVAGVAALSSGPRNGPSTPQAA